MVQLMLSAACAVKAIGMVAMPDTLVPEALALLQVTVLA